MNTMERKALEHAYAQRIYDKSPQSLVDLEKDKQKRAQADIKAGHLPQCSLLKCHSCCPSLTA